MKKILLVIMLVVSIITVRYMFGAFIHNRDMEKVYIALEGEGKIAVLDATTRSVLRTIDLSEQKGGTPVSFMPHNVQVAPDSKTVWVTANVMSMDDHKDKGSDMGMIMNTPDVFDEVIAIDPLTDQVTKRIPIAFDSHLAHVVTSPDSSTLYLTLQEKGELYIVNAETGMVKNKIVFGKDSGPHGLRISPDGGKAFVALVSGKGFAVVDTTSGVFTTYPTQSEVVQMAVTPDGKYAFGSLYGSKAIVRYEITTQKIDTITLPAEAKGPVQLYPTPDSRYLYVADQGYYFGQPTSTIVYRIDVWSGVVDQTIQGGSAPHGVVVDRDGKFVYITNLLSNDLSVIDTTAGKEVARIPVGIMPNGVSIWNRGR